MIRDPDNPDPRYIRLLFEHLDAPMRRIRDLILNPTGGSPASILWNQTRAMAVFAQVQDELQRARLSAARWTSQAVSTAMRQGWTNASRQLLSLGLDSSSAKVSFAQLDTDRLRILARDSYQDLQLALDATGRNVQHTLVEMSSNGLTATEVNKITAGGFVEGNPRQVVTQLRDRLQAIHGQKITIPTANGGQMQFETKDYAQVVAQTRMRQASVLARHERLQRQGVSYVTIIGNVTRWPCTAFLGKIYYIGEGQDPEGRYPHIDTVRTTKGYPAPPFHPNCSKSTAPIVIQLATKEQLKAGEPDLGSEKMAEIGASGYEATRLFQDRQLFASAQSRMKKIRESLQ